jgi:hypothetical protein
MRARGKRLEDIDPAWLCCDAVRIDGKQYEGQMMELEGQPFEVRGMCKDCGAEKKGMVYKIIGEPYSTFICTIDIEEGSK